MNSRLPIAIAYIILVIALAGIKQNIYRYHILKETLVVLTDITPTNRSDIMRFFPSPPLTAEQKSLLESMISSQHSENESLNKFTKTIIEGGMNYSKVQAALWAVVLASSILLIWRLHRSNNSFQGRRPWQAAP